MELVTRATPDAVTPPGSERRIDLRLVTWGEVAERTEEGIKETFARGAFADADPGRVVLEGGAHGGSIAGVAESIEERDDGAYATFRVASTPAGDELLTLTRERVLTDASIVFRPIKQRKIAGGVVERQAAELMRVAILPRGAYPSAQVMAVRSAAEEAVPMTAEPVTMARDEATVSALEELSRRVGAFETMAGSYPARQASPLDKYESVGDYALAVYRGQADADLVYRALADQITTNNAGLVPTGWVSDVKRIVNLGRRAITAFGGPTSLPSSGMDVKWPYVSSANTIIATQATQKTEVQTQRVDIAADTASIVTYAGGSDISLQLLERGDPSYLAAYQRIMLGAWSSVTDAAFCAALEATTGTTTMVASSMLGANITLQVSAAADDLVDAATHGFSIGDAIVFTALTGGTGLTAGRVYWITPTGFTTSIFRPAASPGGTPINFTADITAGTVAKVTDTGQQIRSNLFQASVAIEDATGQPASIALASTDAFLVMAAMSGIVPPNPSGAPAFPTGTAEAASLTMVASGLQIVRTPGISAGKIVLSNREAATWMEDGPRWITADDAAKLGRNVAVYSYGAAASFVPAGIVELTLV